jgi:hypothetical protein
VLLLSQFLITSLLAQAPNSRLGNSSLMVAGMPNPPSSPTKVKCALMILNVADINDVNENFEAEIEILATWKDPRLAFDPAIEGSNVKLFQGSYQFNELFKGWWPQLVILNEVGRNEANAIKVRVFPDGTVNYREQRYVVLETPTNLRAFPFDTQQLLTTMIPFSTTSDKVILEVDEQLLVTSNNYIQEHKEMNVAGWELRGLKTIVDEQLVSLGDVKRTFSRLKTTITIKRISWQMIWSMLFPLLILVSIMWSVFWIDRESIHERLNISLIGVLTIVAYQFVVMENLPRMSYLTFTDILLLLSFVMITITVPQSLIVYSLFRDGRQSLALKVDQICRIAFPVSFAALLFIAALAYGVL